MQHTKREMRVTLTINGEEKTFSKHELVTILEEYFQNTTITHVPTENKWFKVNPETINRELFQEAREDKQQEENRQLILEAFVEIDMDPEKYGRKFETLFPQKTWEGAETVASLKELACKLGERNADWVEQALEWAQRITNGEPWEAICNTDDSAQYYRMVIWKNGNARAIGGSSANGFKFPAGYVYYDDYYHSDRINNTVPLAIRHING